MDSSLTGSSVHGILQARTLQCVAVSFSERCQGIRNSETLFLQYVPSLSSLCIAVKIGMYTLTGNEKLENERQIIRKKFTICMETQKTPNIQSNLEKEKLNWKNQTP